MNVDQANKLIDDYTKAVEKVAFEDQWFSNGEQTAKAERRLEETRTALVDALVA